MVVHQMLCWRQMFLLPDDPLWINDFLVCISHELKKHVSWIRHRESSITVSTRMEFRPFPGVPLIRIERFSGCSNNKMCYTIFPTFIAVNFTRAFIRMIMSPQSNINFVFIQHVFKILLHSSCNNVIGCERKMN